MARKRRCLENGKWYKNKASMARGLKFSVWCKENRTPEEMKALAEKAQAPEVQERRRKSQVKYLKNSKEQSRRARRAYANNPDLVLKRSAKFKETAEIHGLFNNFTDPKAVMKRRTHKNGKQVLRIIKGVRTSSTGVVVCPN